MLQKRAYHEVTARWLVSAGRIEDAERHLDAASILTFVLESETDVELDSTDPELPR